MSRKPSATFAVSASDLRKIDVEAPFHNPSYVHTVKSEEQLNQELLNQEQKDEYIPRPSTEFAVIPPKRVLNSDMTKFEDFRIIRSAYKLGHMKKQFIETMEIYLSTFDKEENAFNFKLLEHVMNQAERFFCSKPKSGAIKRDCVLCLLLPFFRNDNSSLRVAIETAMRHVKKTPTLTRWFDKLTNFVRRHLSNS